MPAIEEEQLARLVLFASTFVLLALAELIIPIVRAQAIRSHRWVTNISMGGLSTFTISLIGPLAALPAAYWSQSQGLGLLNQYQLPGWLSILLGIVLLDFLLYWQHRASHHIPVLWMLHKVHHADTQIDVTTAIRFHPIEILLSMLYKSMCIIALGLPPTAVFLFEVLLSCFALFNHANINLPSWLEEPLRWIVITPRLHNIHHSIYRKEQMKNYGFSVSLWDRIFNSYQTQSNAQQRGLTNIQQHIARALLPSLLIPFARQDSNAPKELQ